MIQAYEIWQVYGPFVTQKRPRFGPGVAERMTIASAVTKDQADAARATHAAARDHLHALIAPGTIVALPSAPCIAPLIDTPAAGFESYRMHVMRLTCIAGLGGLPQVSIPIGSHDGCPVGLSFIGWPGGDEALLDLAVRLARYCGTNVKTRTHATIAVVQLDWTPAACANWAQRPQASSTEGVRHDA